MKDQEHQIQVQVVGLLRMYGFLVFAIPNGGQRNLIVAKKLKAEGTLAGVADLCIVMKNRIIFVEMKTEKGKQQESQKEFEKQVKELGHEYYIWRSVEDALQFIENNKH